MTASKKMVYNHGLKAYTLIMSCKKYILIAILILSCGFLSAEDADATIAIDLDYYLFGWNADSYENYKDLSGGNININGTYDLTPNFFVGANIGMPFWLYWIFTYDSENSSNRGPFVIDPSDKLFTLSGISGFDYSLVDALRLEVYVEGGLIANSFAAGAGVTVTLSPIRFENDARIGVKLDYGYYYGLSIESHQWLPFQKFALGFSVVGLF